MKQSFAKQALLLIVATLFVGLANAQVKIGANPTTINSSSILEIESSNKGFLMPRVALTATNTAGPLAAHVAGMIIYNTATAGTSPNNVVPGVYYNDGTRWVLAKGVSGNGITNTTKNGDGTFTFNFSDGTSFTSPKIVSADAGNLLVSGTDGGAKLTSANLSSATTNILSSSGAIITSNVNGVASSADLTSIVAASSSNLLTLSGATLTSAVNGIASSVDLSSAFAIPDATTTTKGIIQLGGDLRGTAAAPTVPGLLTKEPLITAGTIAQYWRGDKTWQTLDKSVVGLGNVDNTSDANKPVSAATQTALNTKVDKEAGKGLSTNDYTNADKTKLDGIEAGAEKNVNADWNATSGDAQILNKPVIPSIAGLASETFVNNGLALKENTIAAGTITQYWRGDKTWQTLDKSVVGLGNVDNTSDANKPVSAATQTALDTKVNKEAGKGLSTNDYTNADKTKLDGIEAGAEKNVNADWNATTGDAQILNKPVIPSIVGLASEIFVTNAITSSATPDATTTATGKVQLAGDLGGTGSTAAAPVISNNAITTAKINNAAVTNDKLAAASVKNSNIAEVISVENGGSGANMSSTIGYVKQATVGASFTTVAKIPVIDVDGAVRKVNGIVPDANGNVATMLGRVFTGATVDPNLANSIINAPSGKQQSDIYIVADGSNPNNGRTFIYDGTTWLEVATNLSTTDARYVNVAGDTMEGNLTVPTGLKIILADAPTGDTEAANKKYVDDKVAAGITNTTNTLTLTNGQLVSTVNGVATPAVNVLDGAASGLNAANGNVQLGGSLTAATTITTDATNTLAIAGLQNGVAADKMVVVDGNGVLKSVTATTRNINAIVRVTAAHTVADADYTILADATSNAFTLTLPDATTNTGRVLIVRKIDETANVLTFSSAIKISETTTFTTLNLNTTIRIQSDGTAWYKID
jgi:hypothetical protein